MNRQIRQLAGGLMACYVVLFVALNYWQVGRQEELNARFDNTRAIRREFEQPRGPIVTNDGLVVAQSVENPEGSEFRFQRVYPEGELYAHVTGYYTFAFGSTGVERTRERRAQRQHRAAAVARPPGPAHRRRGRLRLRSAHVAQRPPAGGAGRAR